MQSMKILARFAGRLSIFSVLGVALTLATPMAAIGQAYPAKPVRVVIPWPAGGSNDIVGRIVMQKLAESMRP